MASRLENMRVRAGLRRILQPAEGNHHEGDKCVGEARQSPAYRFGRWRIQC